jgi:hypothetical protein
LVHFDLPEGLPQLRIDSPGQWHVDPKLFLRCGEQNFPLSPEAQAGAIEYDLLQIRLGIKQNLHPTQTPAN